MWDCVEVDLHQYLGIDLYDLPDRPWSWLRLRIIGLLTDPASRTHRATRRDNKGVSR